MADPVEPRPVERTPSRHEHEAGAPLTSDCDNWCEAKYRGWLRQKADHPADAAAPPDVVPSDAFGLLRSFLRHRAFVALALRHLQLELERRGLVHDLSKMLDDEFAGFSRINAAARINKFGSPEYAENMRRERGVIDLHFSRNSHHPERPGLLAQQTGGSAIVAYDAGISEHEMTFLDVMEMVCDWWGASKGYDDPRAWKDTVKLNLEQKGKYLTTEQRWLVAQVAEFLGGLHE